MVRFIDKANEKGLYPIRVSFYDDNGQAVAPSTLQWSLLRLDGSIVNGRENVPVSPPASQQIIVLYGEDLKRWPVDNGLRRLFVQGTYTSDLGFDLPYTDEVEFEIEDLVGVQSVG